MLLQYIHQTKMVFQAVSVFVPIGVWRPTRILQMRLLMYEEDRVRSLLSALSQLHLSVAVTEHAGLQYITRYQWDHSGPSEAVHQLYTQNQKQVNMRLLPGGLCNFIWALKHNCCETDNYLLFLSFTALFLWLCTRSSLPSSFSHICLSIRYPTRKKQWPPNLTLSTTWPLILSEGLELS